MSTSNVVDLARVAFEAHEWATKEVPLAVKIPSWGPDDPPRCERRGFDDLPALERQGWIDAAEAVLRAAKYDELLGAALDANCEIALRAGGAR
jgi:hypothetical protein